MSTEKVNELRVRFLIALDSYAGSQVKMFFVLFFFAFFNLVFLSLKIVLSLKLANSADPDEMPRVAFCWLVGFVALRPKSTAMVIAGRSVHLITLFLGQA